MNWNSEKIVKPKGPYLIPLNDKSLCENLKYMVNNKPYTIMGYYVHGIDGKRTKIRNTRQNRRFCHWSEWIRLRILHPIRSKVTNKWRRQEINKMFTNDLINL